MDKKSFKEVFRGIILEDKLDMYFDDVDVTSVIFVKAPEKLLIDITSTHLISREMIKQAEGAVRLFVFEKYDFETFMDKLNEKSDLEAKVRKIKRFFISGAQEMEPDKQGRMLVPPVLREYAGLEKEVVFAGVGGHIEIWDKAKWEDVTSFDDINDIAEELSNIGISF